MSLNFLFKKILGHSERHDVIIEFGPVADTYWAYQISSWFAVHGQGLLVFLAFDYWKWVDFIFLLWPSNAWFIVVFAMGSAMDWRSLADNFRVTVFNLGASLFGFAGNVSGGGEEWGSRSGVGLGLTLWALSGVSIGFDTVEAYFMTTVGTHEVVVVSLAGVTIFAFLHAVVILKLCFTNKTITK